MLYRQYKYKFYLNMNHSVEFGGKKGAVHSHTWEIAMGISVTDGEFTRFSDIEKRINILLDKFQDCYLNETPPFNLINPTLENVCDYLYELIREDLREKGWILLVMEMSETPSRVYRVSGIALDEYTFE